MQLISISLFPYNIYSTKTSTIFNKTIVNSDYIFFIFCYYLLSTIFDTSNFINLSPFSVQFAFVAIHLNEFYYYHLCTMFTLCHNPETFCYKSLSEREKKVSTYLNFLLFHTFFVFFSLLL